MAKTVKTRDWQSWADAFKEENEKRIGENPNDLCDYGISALDDMLFRIGREELVTIGADTGSGKSDLALSIAQHNAMKGKKIAVYYLEGGHLEAIRRMKWRDIADKYYDKHYYRRIDMDYKKWMYHYEQTDLLKEIEAEIYLDYQTKYKDNLFLYPLSKDFTVDEFMFSLLDFHELLTTKLDLDLIVIDHLQYFSLIEAENEITEITKILREVKKITEFFHTPVILISHLRKRGKNSGLPTHEDFYGSGNIAKISTTAIMISPAADRDNLSKNIFPTYFRIVKSRVGVRPNYACLLNFDLNRRKYEEDYDIYRVSGDSDVAKDPLSKEERPKWAREKKEENNGTDIDKRYK